MSFEKEFALEIANVIEASKQIVRAVALTADAHAVINSPRRDGRFVGNWLVATGEESETFDLEKTETQQQAADRIRKEIERAPYTGTFTLFNSVPYARRLDTDWSAQAPAGVTNPAVSHATSQFNGIVQAIERKYKVDK